MAGNARNSSGGAMQGVLLLGTMMMMMCTVVTVRSNEEAVKSKLAGVEYRAPNLYPESFDWDVKHRRFLVGSVSQGKLLTVTEQGAVEEFVNDEEYTGASILGVAVDSVHNRVLAMVHRFNGPPLSALAAYDLDSKKRTLFVNFIEDGPRSKLFPSDVAVDSEGNAFVTDSACNLIWKVTFEGIRSVLVAFPPQIPVVVEMEQAKEVSCSGIVHHDGYLVVSQTNSGALIRVRLADNEVHVVKIKDGVQIPGAGGLALRSDGSLVVVTIQTAWLVSTSDSWSSASIVDKVLLDAADFKTSAAVNELHVFVLHHHMFDKTKGIQSESLKIVEIEFPSDSYNNPLWLLAIVGIFAVLVLSWKFQMNRFNKEYTKKRM